MASISSLRNWDAVKVAARAAAEGAVAGVIVAAAAALIWRGPAERAGIFLGLGVAWLASSAGTAALMLAKAHSPEAFWWAFGGGMAVRTAVLIALVGFSVYHPGLSQPALLVSYALGVLGFLLLEYRHIRLK